MSTSPGIGSFYRGKSVLITGHTGFKGGWMAEWLRLLGAEVTGLSLPLAYPDRPVVPAARGDGFRSLEVDIRDREALVEAVRAAQPEIVFHLAAQALVRRSYHDPAGTFATNVLGTAHLLDAVREVPSVRAVVVVTSDKCYENREWVWGYRESDPMGGKDPYSASKGCAELVVASYRRGYFEAEGRRLGLATTRAGNVIGGGDWSEDRIVPDLVRGLTAGERVLIRSPDAVRPWQHVLEPLHGYLELGRRLWSEPEAFSSGWNFGPNEEGAVPVHRLVDLFLETWGGGEIEVSPPSSRFPEAHYLRLDCSKARVELDWKPVLRLEDAVQLTAHWYRVASHRPERAGEVTRRQILKYMELRGEPLPSPAVPLPPLPGALVPA